MAAYKIFFKKSVEKDFKVIPKKDLIKILKSIEALADPRRQLQITTDDNYKCTFYIATPPYRATGRGRE
jgi:mRNA interferase RelE/StbE